MKAFAFIALLALVASSVAAESTPSAAPSSETQTHTQLTLLGKLIDLIDLPASHDGWAKELGLNEAQTASAEKCWKALKTNTQNLKDVYTKEGQNKIQLAIGLVGTAELFKIQVFEACGDYISQLRKYADEKRVTTKSASTIIQKVNNMYKRAFLSRHTFEIIDALDNHDANALGVSSAKLWKIINDIPRTKTGSKFPDAFSKKKYDLSNESHNLTHIYTEFYTGFLEATQIPGIKVEDLVKCGEAKMDLSESIIKFKKLGVKDITGKFKTFLRAGEDLTVVNQACAVELHLLRPIYRQFKENPIETVKKLIHNIGIDAPELVYLTLAKIQDYHVFDYKGAGKAYGYMYEVIRHGI